MLTLDIIEYTNKAMLMELFTYPSFGLVSPYSTGSHTDMDHYTFLNSTSVINKYMVLFANLGYQEKTIESMYDEAILIGKRCEEAMFQATDNINTHKGLIFVLGTLVISSMKALHDKTGFESIFTNCQLLLKEKLNELQDITKKDTLSHGEAIYLKHHIAGVRKEASEGFPIIQKALKVFDRDEPSSCVKTLVYIMSMCDDTTIIHRLGLDTLKEVKDTMRRLVEKGFDYGELIQIEETFINKGISPGGSADLLSGTIFLGLIKHKFNK